METASKQIFIVDDDEITLNGLVSHVPWSSLGIQVMGTAENGADALSRIRGSAAKPDIVMTDIYMPEMDGFQFIQAMQEELPHIPVIILSGHEEFENARQAMRFGVSHFLLKPANLSEIEEVVKEVLLELEVSEKEQKLQQFYQEQVFLLVPSVKETFFRETLAVRYKESELSEGKLELIGLSRHDEVRVASLSLLRSAYMTKNRERDWQLLKFGANNIIQEVCRLHEERLRPVQVHVLDYSDQRIVFIFTSAVGCHPEKSIALLQEIIDKILLYLKISLVVGIGGPKPGLHRMIDSYLESLQTLKAAEYMDINKVYTIEEFNGTERDEPLEYPVASIQQIYEVLERQDLTKFKEVWGQLKQLILDADKPLLSMVFNIYTTVLSSLAVFIPSAEGRQESSLEMSGIIREMQEQTSVKALTEWMDRFLEAFITRTNGALGLGGKSNELIEKVKDWVSVNYDKDVSFSDIARSQFVNRSYLSHLFKKVTGETFVSYLTKYRIQKAIELLKQRKYMIGEVSLMVGFQNPAYFSQVFKSVTGCSPSDYLK